MTGYGRAEVTRDGITAAVEVRSVNSRYLDVTTRTPRSLSHREKDLKDIVRAHLSRGSVNLTIRIERQANGATPLKVNATTARAYYRMLADLRKAVKLREQVRLEHLLNFSEIFEPVDEEGSDEKEWRVAEESVRAALKDLNAMRVKEGKELVTDLRTRITWMESVLTQVEQKSAARIPEERARLQERIAQMVSDPAILDQKRLELEIALLSDKLDVTEECVRYRSHNKFFLEALEKGEAAGRKLNFLVQEMNREANTIGSKTNDAEIAHIVVGLKEELEKIREQLQNIE